jgi:signal transduction histidine kinase
MLGPMPTPPRCPRARAAYALTLLLLCLAVGAEAASPKRVLILHSFGRDFAPYDTYASVFRAELARSSSESIVFSEATLDAGRSLTEKEQQAFLDYLKARFEGLAPDVVVTLGPPAGQYYLAHRGQLFPGTPLVVAALDERFVKGVQLGVKDAAVLTKVDIPRLFDNVLQLMPDTQTIAVVIGASELERFWLGEAKREAGPYKDRVNFQWLNDLSLEQMEKRVAELPARSAIIYGLFITDAATVPHERQDALLRLHTVADAPIFGIYEDEIGKGVVGGPHTSQRRHGQQIAAAALGILNGTAGPGPRVSVDAFQPPIYDWRELDRWNIDPNRLPPGSAIRFKRPSIWDEHRVAVVAATIALFVQAVLIAGLLIQRAHRRRAEREAQHLGGRILTVQEDERRRLAREMHDDVTQRLASLAIDTAKVQSILGSPATARPLDAIRQRLVTLSKDVHALSYRLHPSVIDDWGLVAALKAECNRVTLQEPIRVDFDSQAIPKKLPPNTAVCLFRVAQEALRNVVRHAHARKVEVLLKAERGGISLAVRDDGTGFADSVGARRTSLGLVSMRERIRLVNGKLDIVSRPDQGTSVVAWVPLTPAA